ncbi:MAG: DUF3012 domain-containing protein [Zhongshania sp.]|uniref:DUF3012 domain-containing protein n=1 Tax=Zhongshania sp. TaxID=1971902 RepID=UPI002612893E|nr:DUF3012 domain-containing protein [Zhongshania sp.]MDF1690944.1 DUF3012 domain-containing protein [Zhongshania sp.]
MKKTITLFGLLVSVTLITACAPEIGSDAWCAGMENKPKGDWTMTETKDYGSNCLFK